MPSALACLMTERSLVPKMPLDFAFTSSASSVGMGFISCTPLASSARPLSIFRNGTTCFLRPQELGGGHALDVAIHGGFEQDGAGDAIAAEGRAGDDARAHGVDQIHHLRFAGIGVLGHAVQLQRLRGAAAALIQGRDEARLVADLGGLLLEIAHESSLR